MKRITRKLFVATLVCMFMSHSFLASAAMAGTFKRTKTMTIAYAWGTCSMAEFDDYVANYPGTLPTADVTFHRDGTADIVDNTYGTTGNGIYDKRGKKLDLTLVAPTSPFGVVQYVGKRVSSGVWEGEILVDGVVWGHWRGSF